MIGRRGLNPELSSKSIWTNLTLKETADTVHMSLYLPKDHFKPMEKNRFRGPQILYNGSGPHQW